VCESVSLLQKILFSKHLNQNHTFMTLLIFLALITIGGIYLITKLSFIALNLNKIYKSGKRTTGEIIDYKIAQGGKGNYYFPIVKYRTLVGKEIIQKSNHGFNQKERDSQRNAVELAYLEDEPTTFVVIGKDRLKPLILIIASMVIMLPLSIWIMIDNRPDLLQEIVNLLN
jgi:hypothetical protein